MTIARNLFSPWQIARNLFLPWQIAPSLFSPWHIARSLFSPWQIARNLFSPWQIARNLFSPWQIARNLFSPWQIARNLFSPWQIAHFSGTLQSLTHSLTYFKIGYIYNTLAHSMFHRLLKFAFFVLLYVCFLLRPHILNKYCIIMYLMLFWLYVNCCN